MKYVKENCLVFIMHLYALMCLCINVSGFEASSTTTWSRPVIIYTSSYAQTQRSHQVAIRTPQLVGNFVWSIQQLVSDGCPIYPMEILISTQHGAVPWLNQSDWSSHLLVLQNQRFAITLDDSTPGAHVKFDSKGARLFYFSVISLKPEPAKLERLGLLKQSCDTAVHFTPTGNVPISMPLLRLDTNTTVVIQPGQVQFFRLAVPQMAYSVQLEITGCHLMNSAKRLIILDSSDCQLFASVSAGAASDPRPARQAATEAATTSPRTKTRLLLFADRLSPLTDDNYLSLAHNAKFLLSFNILVRMHQYCRPLLYTTSSSPATSASKFACELFPLGLQNYDIYGGMSISPSSPNGAEGTLRIHRAMPVVIPFKIDAAFDSVRYLLIDIETRAEPASLDFCLSRQLSLGLDSRDKFCELQFSLDSRTGAPLHRVMPHPPAGVWYLAIVNRLTVRAEILLDIRTKECPAECLKGGRCEKQSLESLSIFVCRCYDGFGGDLCESRVPVSPNPLASLLLLCLSNAAFLPTVVLAWRRGLLVEGLMYCTAMLASTLYHACDNNYSHHWCVLPFDTLGKLDFLGAFLSLWVTLLLLIDLTLPVKQLMQTAGSLFLMIGVLIDRTSFVIIAVPLGFGFLALIVSWSCRCYTNRRCYPPMRLFVTSLLPGGVLALVGFAMFALVDTRSNYYLVHSGWHCCVAIAILLFILPRDPLRFLPRSSVDVGGAVEGRRNCGIDRCFVLGSRGVHGADDPGDGVGLGINGEIEYSVLPMVDATVSSSRNGVLSNGLTRRPSSAMSLSSSGGEEGQYSEPAEDLDEQQAAEVSRQLASIRVGRRRSPGQQATIADSSGEL